MSATTTIINSPIGPLTLTERDGALVGLSFGARGPCDPPTPLLRRATGQLNEYFAGMRREFDLPLAPAGTEFQLACWHALTEIPYGETRSYGEQAARIGRPDRARAVGAANGANPIAIIQPCHRVIGADGSLVGFGGGLETKRRLLDLEAGILSLV